MLNRNVPNPVHKPAVISSAGLFAPGSFLAFGLVTSLFFLWGIPNNLNDILIRQFMKSFPITRLEAGFVQSAFYMGYFLLALPSAFYMRKFGYKAGFITGLDLVRQWHVSFLAGLADRPLLILSNRPLHHGCRPRFP